MFIEHAKLLVCPTKNCSQKQLAFRSVSHAGLELCIKFLIGIEVKGSVFDFTE